MSASCAVIRTSFRSDQRRFVGSVMRSNRLRSIKFTVDGGKRMSSRMQKQPLLDLPNAISAGSTVNLHFRSHRPAAGSLARRLEQTAHRTVATTCLIENPSAHRQYAAERSPPARGRDASRIVIAPFPLD